MVMRYDDCGSIMCRDVFLDGGNRPYTNVLCWKPLGGFFTRQSRGRLHFSSYDAMVSFILTYVWYFHIFVLSYWGMFDTCFDNTLLPKIK